MAKRPIFSPYKGPYIGVKEPLVEFDWHPGMAVSQKQKSIRSLHAAAAKIGISPALEISSKSENELGIKLSAFNLTIVTRLHRASLTVETAFQGSKIFERGGPYKDLYGLDSMKAKKDPRLKESGNIVGFKFFGQEFPTKPRTFFYDWIYINAINQNSDLAEELDTYQGFTDIEFNPERSVNCQARSAALFVSLKINGALQEALNSPQSFLEQLKSHYASAHQQHSIQDSFV